MTEKALYKELFKFISAVAFMTAAEFVLLNIFRWEIIFSELGIDYYDIEKREWVKRSIIERIKENIFIGIIC
jgi:hypothetical protein